MIVLLNPDRLGGFSYQHDGSETIVDQFQYTLDDQDGCAAAGPFNVTVNVTPVNDCPIAVDDNYLPTSEVAEKIIEIIKNG